MGRAPLAYGPMRYRLTLNGLPALIARRVPTWRTAAEMWREAEATLGMGRARLLGLGYRVAAVPAAVPAAVRASTE